MSALRVDVKGARSALQRRLARGPAQLADGFARIVRSAPEQRLEQVMRTPVRRAVLEGIFWQMPQYFDAQAATTMNATIRWRVTGASESQTDVYELEIKEGRCRVHRGEREAQPTVTITLSGAEFVRLATGNADPIQGYMKGRIKLAGDIMVAARLQTLFRIPGSPQSSRTVSSSR